MKLSKEVVQLLAMVLPLIILVASIPLLSRYVPGQGSGGSAVEEVSSGSNMKEFRITVQGLKASTYCDVGSCIGRASKSIDLSQYEQIAELLDKGYVVSSIRVVSVTAALKSGKSWGWSEGHRHWFVVEANGGGVVSYDWVGSVSEQKAFNTWLTLSNVQTIDIVLVVGAANVFGSGGAWTEVEVQIIIYVTLVKKPSHLEAVPGTSPNETLQG